MDLAFLASENAARKSGRDVTLGLRLDSSSEESGDEGEGEAFEKRDFLKTYSSRVQLDEHMATLARESRPQIRGGELLDQTCQNKLLGNRMEPGMASLPYYANMQDKTPSEAQKSLQRWLASKAGQGWLQQRQNCLS